MTRLKNRIHSVLHGNLITSYNCNLFTTKGQAWLRKQPIAEEERRTIDCWLAELDRLGDDLKRADEVLVMVGSGD